MVHGDLPPYEAFPIGGTNSVRGYAGTVTDAASDLCVLCLSVGVHIPGHTHAYAHNYANTHTHTRTHAHTTHMHIHMHIYMQRVV